MYMPEPLYFSYRFCYQTMKKDSRSASLQLTCYCKRQNKRIS